MRKYTWYSDPGHEWLAVPMADIRELGVTDKVSAYSYISADGKTAYLEGDCDAGVVLNRFADGLVDMTKEINEPNNDSFIRALDQFPSVQ